MALTQDAADALLQAIATGIKRAAYEGRSVEYHPLDEMMRALAIVETEVAVQAGESNRCTFASFRRD